MRKIMVLNTKGGSGKTTLATNLASYYAAQDKSVVLVDLDPQASSLGWLAARPEDYPPIQGLNGRNGSLRPPKQTDYLIVDTPAASYGRELTALIRRAETVLIPVQPSATDMRAAANFIRDLRAVGKVGRKQVKLALVANRLREVGALAGTLETLLGSIKIPYRSDSTEVNASLEEFLESQKVPFIASLKDSDNYLQADAQGIGIFELPSPQARNDQTDWEPLLDWLDSRRSVPKKS